MVSPIVGSGTSEQVWRPFLAGIDLPGLDLARAPDRVVVVAPHPDDEVLTLGGLLVLLAQAGSRLEVVAVTDGEASHPGGSVAPAELAQVRVRETEAALSALGIGGVTRRLGCPDGAGDRLEGPVVDSVLAGGDCWLLGPWSGDGHPDHEAVGRACARVAQRDGARLLEYPVWAWHWADPGSTALPWHRAVQVELPARVAATKARAVGQFVSQVQPLGPLDADAPVLPLHVLARFARPFEVAFA